jgi:hypothetical protein
MSGPGPRLPSQRERAAIPAPKAISVTRLEVRHFSIEDCDFGLGTNMRQEEFRGGKLDAFHRESSFQQPMLPRIESSLT